MHCLHLFGFSPLCFFRCILNLSVREDVKSHLLHLFGFSPLCDFDVSSNCLPPKMQSHTALFWFISAMCFEMSLQMAYLRKYTLVVHPSLLFPPHRVTIKHPHRFLQDNRWRWGRFREWRRWRARWRLRRSRQVWKGLKRWGWRLLCRPIQLVEGGPGVGPPPDE